MLGNTLGITYNAVTKTLSRVKDDGYTADYYLDDGQQKYTLSVKHTVPPRGEPNESHMVRLDVAHYDANGVYLRTASAWSVLKTFDAVQDTVSSTRCANALVGLTDSTFVGKLAVRES
jgi:hypothetical protein